MRLLPALLIFLSSQSTFVFAAPELKPAKTFSEIVFTGALDLTNVVKIPTAQVLTADYPLIRKDFPQLGRVSEKEIDQWLLNQVGYLTKNQVLTGEGSGANLAIQAQKTEIKKALRPPEYNRALVFQTNVGGLIDVKGAGSELPSRATHKNGLMETAEAIREHFYTKAVKEILSDAKMEQGVVDSYAVIDWGFHLHDLETANTYRAGAILRQAHVRDFQAGKRKQGQLDRSLTKKIETQLRKYGVTSAVKRKINSQLKLDAVNIQGTKDGKFIYDFGSFRVMDRFQDRAVAIEDFAKEAYQEWEKHTMLDPESPHYPQPNPQKHLSYELWNGAGTNGDQEKIWLQARELAHELDQKKPIAEVRAKIEKLLSEYQVFTSNHGLERNSCLKEVLESLKSIN